MLARAQQRFSCEFRFISALDFCDNCHQNPYYIIIDEEMICLACYVGSTDLMPFGHEGVLSSHFIELGIVYDAPRFAETKTVATILRMGGIKNFIFTAHTESADTLDGVWVQRDCLSKALDLLDHQIPAPTMEESAGSFKRL